MEATQDGIKFLQAEISNYKGITAKTVDIGGKSLVVIGGNGRDKSSFLQVLKASVDAKFMPEKPLKDGEERGSFKVVIGGNLDGKHKEYTIEYIFTLGNGKGKVIVTNAAGEVVKSPKSTIEALVGDISFDVFKFIDMPKSKQIDCLKRLTGKHVEIDLIEIEKKKKTTDKTTKNNEVTFFEKTIGNHTYTDEQLDMYSEIYPLDKEAEIKASLVTISKDLTDYNKIKNGVPALEKANFDIKKDKLPETAKNIILYNEQIEALKLKIEEEEAKAKLLRETVDANDVKIEAGKKWLEIHVEPNVKTISDQIEAINTHNNHHAQIKALQKKQLDLIKMKDEVNKIVDDIKRLDLDRDNIIKNSKIPVKGLTFTEETILFEGLPFDDLQLNKAKIIEIGMQIGMALNPKLKVCWIGDGGLLDKDSLKAVVDIAEKAGYQIIIEMVKFEGGEMEVLFAEEFLN